ncbi:nucleotidyl transferase AbiEii/AbiGii toxin family protein [Novosphingobium album (ex Liu et al. 2023)]|uniref:Nucleotidyl transferase AbiEii/AbiGii toxin family protein n=1 Tax=Novosphingobium album (ex Liu et al. 2023) TaxID=3031130 RepID=A0ABT5WWH6_9SPHN|nr:nucleotidyl transferase AbiEii/AbiGii toxin family protein [Novosphingobium album (ex Liu et al. 2023)]MDE8654260.1 nucleotidyl transferase AbiEii/AbiGii toxin family protein [Novosphingobium album (ex Liu et al. 2023)]
MIDMLQKKLRDYGATNALEEENAIKEILQEIALYALWRADFFEVALFQGGTSLRILHALPRFSEDLDFLLRVPDPDFQWARYLAALVDIFGQFGLKLDAQPKDKMDRVIREAILKDDSIANQLNLSFAGSGRARTIRIKLEIDTNPPAGSGEATTFLDFPADYEVRHQDLASNFALKIHALLCRPYLKGRDWFDFSWYVANGAYPNLELLAAALLQTGPWQGQRELQVDGAWLIAALHAKIAAIDWNAAAADVSRFLRPAEAKSLSLWSERFFGAKLDQLAKGAAQ